MLRRLLSVALALALGGLLSAASDFIVPTVADIRSAGMGGSHLCDFRQPFVLLDNPSGMVFSGKQVFFPSLALDFGGPPNVSKLLGMLGGDGDVNLMDALVDMLKESNGIFIDADVMLPLAFSRVANNWGIGVYNNVFLRGDLPSVSSVSAVAAADLMLAGGFAVPLLDRDFQRLSLGISTKLLGRFGVVYQGAVTELASLDYKSLPAELTLAAGFDVGATYSLWDILSFSLVWKDLYLGMSHGLGAVTSMEFSDEEWDRFVASGDLAFGIGVQVPLGVVERVVSSLSVYVDFINITSMFNKEKAIFLPHPLLNLSVGLEAVLFRTVALRFGLAGPYLAAGLGVDLGVFHISMAIYGKEKGLDPGQSAQVHGALALSFYY